MFLPHNIDFMVNPQNTNKRKNFRSKNPSLHSTRVNPKRKKEENRKPTWSGNNNRLEMVQELPIQERKSFPNIKHFGALFGHLGHHITHLQVLFSLRDLGRHGFDDYLSLTALQCWPWRPVSRWGFVTFCQRLLCLLHCGFSGRFSTGSELMIRFPSCFLRLPRLASLLLT